MSDSVINKLLFIPLTLSQRTSESHIARVYVNLFWGAESDFSITLLGNLYRDYEDGCLTIDFPDVYEDLGVPGARLKQLPVITFSDILRGKVIEAVRRSWEHLSKKYGELDGSKQYVIVSGGKIYSYPLNAEIDLNRRIVQ